MKWDDPNDPGARIFCMYRDYYWHARCSFRTAIYESESRTHGSARQAADEVLGKIRAEHGAAVTMRRVSPKQRYAIFLPAEKEDGCEQSIK